MTTDRRQLGLGPAVGLSPECSRLHAVWRGDGRETRNLLLQALNMGRRQLLRLIELSLLLPLLLLLQLQLPLLLFPLLLLPLLLRKSTRSSAPKD